MVFLAFAGLYIPKYPWAPVVTKLGTLGAANILSRSMVRTRTRDPFFVLGPEGIFRLDGAKSGIGCACVVRTTWKKTIQFYQVSRLF